MHGPRGLGILNAAGPTSTERWINCRFEKKSTTTGPGSSTCTVPSGSVVMPRAFVSWRSPVPSGRIAKSWLPNGLPPTGSQLDENSTVPVIRSRKT